MTAEPVLILGIETSCDETAVAVVADGRRILGNIVSSQVDLHARFGGVVPEIASRQHLILLNSLIDDTLQQAGKQLPDMQAVAVSHGPGLVGALLVGVAGAKALAYALRKPLIAVNHLEAHLYANHLENVEIEFPAVALIVSGGHTELLLLADAGHHQALGRTRDDAAGEVFDKVARVMGLGYPGGPLIEQLAAEGNRSAIDFPRAWLEENSSDFSFSGLKTAVINYLYHQDRQGFAVNRSDLAASFQEALFAVLVAKTVAAAESCRAKSVLLAGGVAANNRLRSYLNEQLAESLPAVSFYSPSPELCTDNAAMIAAAAYQHYLRGNFAPLDLNAQPALRIIN